jgi:hypothetical protein
MKKILFTLLLLIPLVAFPQATGKVITDKPSGGTIGSAASTVDLYTLFNLNQTTAGQILAIPNLTNVSAGKIIYVNNIGSVNLTLIPGGKLPVGRGVILRWDGTIWNSCSPFDDSEYVPFTDAIYNVHFNQKDIIDVNKIEADSVVISKSAKISLSDSSRYRLSSAHPLGALLKIDNTSPKDSTFAGIILSPTNIYGTNQVNYIGSISNGNNKRGGNIVFGGGDSSGTYAEWLRINNIGSVGIGTRSPTAKLDIVNTTQSVGAFAASTFSTTTSSYGGIFALDVTPSVSIAANGLYSSIIYRGTSNNTSTALSSIYSIAYNRATAGTVTNFGGNLIDVRQLNAGLITNMFGLKVRTMINTGGSSPGAVDNIKCIEIEDQTLGVTNNFGIYSAVSSGTGKYNFCSVGTAQNYSAGNFGFGPSVATPLSYIHVGAGTSSVGQIILASSTPLTVAVSGNINRQVDTLQFTGTNLLRRKIKFQTSPTYVRTAATATVNTTTTVIGQITNPSANPLEVGSCYKIKIYGENTSSAANASTFYIKVGNAGTTADNTVVSFPVTSATSGTAIPFMTEIYFTVISLGGSGTSGANATVINTGTTGINTKETDVIAQSSITYNTFNTSTANYLSVCYSTAAATTTSQFASVIIERIK